MAKVADYSEPLTTLLRTNIMGVHDSISNSHAAKALSAGKLPKQEYVRLLMMLWHVYSALEQALDEHASYPGLESTYNPAILSRTQAISSDISYLLQVPEDAWQSHPIYINLTTNTPPALSAYLDRIHQLARASTAPFHDEDNEMATTTVKHTQCKPHVALLLSHAYVRYLGDLSGGQIIRYALGKAYNLDLDSASSSGPGITFYQFQELCSSKVANQGELKRIKEWFKEGMNDAGEKIGPMGKQAIILEAKEAFRLNADLLECLQFAELSEADSARLKPTKAVNNRSALKSVVASIQYASTSTSFYY
ncbi:heme oxygenase 1 [Amanita rubescens]|nr:heme oxygenase 1 [Amanita rubescens]